MKMLLERTRTYVDPPTHDIAQALSDALAVPVPGARFSQLVRTGRWDGKKRFYDMRNKSFPTGLAPFVYQTLKALRADGHPVGKIIAVDNTEPLLPADRVGNRTEDDLKGLRGYQIEAVNAVTQKQFLGQPFPRGIIQAPTGSGKSAIAAGLIARYGVPKNTLVVVHRQLLAVQLAKSTAGWLRHKVEEYGQFGDGEQRFPYSDRTPIIFGMIQTLTREMGLAKKGAQRKTVNARLKSWLDNVELLIVDEAHRVNDAHYAAFLDHVPASVRVAFSATPLKRGDVGDIALVGAFGPILYKKLASELKGYLAQGTVVMHPVSLRIAGSATWPEVENAIIDDADRNAMLCAQAQGNEPALVLFRKLRHGAILYDTCRALGMKPALLSGSSCLAVRQLTIKRFEAGKVNPLIASTILNEGVDIPAVSRVIITSGGKSEIEAIQRAGRGSRPKGADGGTFTIHDCKDVGHRIAERHSVSREGAYVAAGYAVKTED